MGMLLSVPMLLFGVWLDRGRSGGPPLTSRHGTRLDG